MLVRNSFYSVFALGTFFFIIDFFLFGKWSTFISLVKSKILNFKICCFNKAYAADSVDIDQSLSIDSTILDTYNQRQVTHSSQIATHLKKAN